MRSIPMVELRGDEPVVSVRCSECGAEMYRLAPGESLYPVSSGIHVGASRQVEVACAGCGVRAKMQIRTAGR